MADKNLPAVISPEEWSKNPLAPGGGIEHTWRLADMFAKSDLVRAHFRGKPNNVMIAINMAARMNLDAFMVMQHMYVLHGTPGLEAQLVIALVNQSGQFTPLNWRFEGEGDERVCICHATHLQTKKEFEYALEWATVVAEGWNKKNGSKWNTMPEHMMRYRSAAYFARMYCPQLILGMCTIQELRDIPEAELISDAKFSHPRQNASPAKFKKPGAEEPDKNQETYIDHIIRDWHDLNDLVPELVKDAAKNMEVSSNPANMAGKQELIIAVCRGMAATQHELAPQADEILAHYGQDADEEPF